MVTDHCWQLKMIAVKPLKEDVKKRKNGRHKHKKKKKNRRNDDKYHHSMPNLLNHMVPPQRKTLHAKSDQYVNDNDEYTDSQQSESYYDPSQFIQVYQSFDNTTYHSLVKLNPRSCDNKTNASPITIDHSINTTPIKHMPSNPLKLPALPTSQTTPIPYTENRTETDPLMSHVNYITNINNRANQIPFISEDSNHSVSSYPSILALKLSFTNQASNEPISILSPIKTIIPMMPTMINNTTESEQNGEFDDDDTIDDAIDAINSSDSSFYENEYEQKDNDDNTAIDITNVDKKAVTTANAKHMEKTNNNKNKNNTLKLMPYHQNSENSSLLDHEDAYDPPQPSLHNSPSTVSVTSQLQNIQNIHNTNININNINNINNIQTSPDNKPNKVRRNNQYKIHPMLQSVVEDVSDIMKHRTTSNKSKISLSNDASVEYQQYKRRRDEFNKIINQNKRHIQQNSNTNVNVSIKINDDNYDICKRKHKHKHKIIRKRQKSNYRNKSKLKSKSKTKTKSTSLVITSNKRSAVEIRRPQTSKISTLNTHAHMLNKRNIANTNENIMNMRVFRYELGSPSSNDSSDNSASYTTTTNTSRTSSNTSHTYSTKSVHVNNTKHMHSLQPIHTNSTDHDLTRSSTVNITPQYRSRRQVRIIRRSNKVNNMVRATSAAIPGGHGGNNIQNNNNNKKKYGLFDDDMCIMSKNKNKNNNKNKQVRYRHEAKENDVLCEWDKFYLESRINPKSFAGTSDISHLNLNSMNYEQNILRKLTVDNNENHQLCKKEIHDAYERGFLAGYFLGVNIMQQQKDINEQSIAK